MQFLDYAVMGFILAAVLIVGWLSARKTKDSDDFLTAGKGLNKLQTGFSMAATDFGGSALVGAIGYCYFAGMGGMWWNLAAAPAFLFVGLFLAKKLNHLNGATVPDYLGNRYCTEVKYITSTMHIMANIALLSSQFTVSAAMLYTITGLDIRITLVISVLLVVLLTNGGLRAVVNTDATLFVVIALSVALAAPLSLHYAGGLSAVAAALPEGFMNAGSIGFWKPLSWGIMCTLGYATNQNYVQRMVSAKDEGTATFASLFTAGFYLVISVLLGLVGVASAVLLPGIEDSNTIFPQLLMEYFPKGLTGLGVSGVFAATISTGTSILHGTTILFVNDLWKPFSKDIRSAEKELRCSRITPLVLAAFSTVSSLFFTNIITVIYTAGLFYSIAVFFPMILGIYSELPTAKGAIVSVIGAVVTGLFWEFMVSKALPTVGVIPSNIIGLAVSFMLLIGISALDKKK